MRKEVERRKINDADDINAFTGELSDGRVRYVMFPDGAHVETMVVEEEILSDGSKVENIVLYPEGAYKPSPQPRDLALCTDNLAHNQDDPALSRDDPALSRDDPALSRDEIALSRDEIALMKHMLRSVQDTPEESDLIMHLLAKDRIKNPVDIEALGNKLRTAIEVLQRG